MNQNAGIRALAIESPRGVRTNQYWRNHYPEIVNAIDGKLKLKVWSGPEQGEKATGDFDIEMAPYLKDPFRGMVERRVLTPGESALTLEFSAAKKALLAARMAPDEVDLMIVTSFLPDHFGCMNAPYLARDLGLRGAAWNLESACSSAMMALQTATALVQAGEHQNVLVVTSCCYSRDTDPADTISWTVGDGAGAFVVGPVESGFGKLGAHSVHTGNTCGALWFENYQQPDGKLWFRLLASSDAGKVLRDKTDSLVRECSQRALQKAAVSLDQIDHFVVNTPTAWYAKSCARALGVDPTRFTNTHAKYGNMGPALLPLNLFHAAQERPIKRGDLVLLYSVGSISSAGALVMRWGDVALSEMPAAATVNCD